MTNANPAPLFALLVGIDDYASPNVPNLSGCANDIEALALLLQDRFAVPPENIQTLTNGQATRQAIEQAFQHHLVARARGWHTAGATEPPPAFLFHYSGHGSQAPDETGIEPDGLDETIVPHNSRTAGIYDIKDWELGRWIDELTAPFTPANANVTLILDCCHAGSGTRERPPTLVATRRCPPDLRPQPGQRPTASARARGVAGPSGWELGGKYVLLAACRDREEANEFVAPHGQPGQRRYGAMTYFLLQALNRMPPARPLTYRDLHERVRYQVNSRFESQLPQCEGLKDREIFGGLKPLAQPLLTVVEVADYIWVNGGAAHGLTVGSQLHVYPPGSTSPAAAGEPLATLYVAEVGAVKSGCLVESGQREIELHARLAIAHVDAGPMRQQVALEIPDGGVKNEVTRLLTDPAVTPYVQLAPPGQPASLCLRQVEADIRLQDAAGQPLVAAFPPEKRHEIARDLAHIARYANALNLTNPAGNLSGALQVEFRRLAVAGGQLQAAPLPRNAEDEVELEIGEKIVIEVTNRAAQPLYVAVFNLAQDWAIHQLYPTTGGAHEALTPGNSLRLGLSSVKNEQLAPNLPPGINEAREFIKVIATVDETDFELLQLPALKTPGETRTAALPAKRSALTALLERAAAGSGARALGAPPTTTADEWTTAELQFRILRPLTNNQAGQAVPGGRKTPLPGFNLSVEPPPGFAGQIRVLTPRQATRAAGGDLTELSPPAGLAARPDLFQPVGLPATGSRSALGAPGAVIELEADDASRAAISEAAPLKLHLPPNLIAPNTALMALAYDGSFFYPVGSATAADAGLLAVQWLPDAAPPDETAVRTRNIGRTLKLYLFKTLQWDDPSLGLYSARFVPEERLAGQPPQPNERSYAIAGGEARYRPLQAGELRSGQRVALFIHGFTSQTKWMVSGILPWLEQNGHPYHHYLTFDYETFNTRISDNGQTLANLLKTAGFGPADDLHLDIFAHSMGTLVARSLVEQWGGAEFVDRCFLAGPPNQGSRLAEAKRLVPVLVTLGVNQLVSFPPAVVAGWAMKEIANDCVGGDDLRPGSEFIRQINAAAQPAQTPYYILAGRNQLPDDAANTAWQRFCRTLARTADLALDTLFSDQNDLIISVHSMQTVRHGNYPPALLQTALLPCNHFQYFSSAAGQASLLDWLNR